MADGLLCHSAERIRINFRQFFSDRERVKGLSGLPTTPRYPTVSADVCGYETGIGKLPLRLPNGSCNIKVQLRVDDVVFSQFSDFTTTDLDKQRLTFDRYLHLKINPALRFSISNHKWFPILFILFSKA